MKPEDYKIDSTLFVLANNGDRIKDKELATKPVGYFKDAFYRFRKNKGSIVAFFIILFLVLFAIFGPLFTPYNVSYNDKYMNYCLPKSHLFANTNFWDGCSSKTVQEETFLLNYSMGVETGHNSIKNQYYTTHVEKSGSKNQDTTFYTYRYDSYQKTGVVYMNLTKDEYLSIQQYQKEKNIQVIYPITDPDKRPSAVQDQTNANYWYETKISGGKTVSKVTKNADGTFTYKNIYLAYENCDDYDSIRIEGETPKYEYALEKAGVYECRVNYYEYYIYYHSYKEMDGIGEPCFLFGSNHSGQDIFTCLGSGARFSFLLSIIVTSVNLFIGAIYGSIEGYYGGKLDLFMERFVEILGSTPFMVVITLLKYHMGGSSQVLVLFIAFFLTGWIGMAGRTRMQFYRFKNQEYVLAARTLGASDSRIMFKHIFPNAIGTLITGSVLAIPAMIFSETSLSYLGIINLNTGSMTSVGTLLASAQPYLSTYPYMIVTPSIFICLLMLSFNLFGNGLRDAFNPSLRGSEE